MKIYTKEEIIEKLKEIREMGWICSGRQGNVGGIGNTLEDLLGIEENNLPIPNASEWELKCQRIGTSSLTTGFHMEPSPRAVRFVPKVLLPSYGWSHQDSGGKYSLAEMSFRQTITGTQRSDRGFKVVVDRAERKILISFDATAVDQKHADWLEVVKKQVGLDELEPQPYWGFDDVGHKAATKLLNCFYVQADTKREGGKEYFKYDTIMMLRNFNGDAFVSGIEQGFVYVDFDARSGHNHGTKFRWRKNRIADLYGEVVPI